jgi:hypothetical protein
VRRHATELEGFDVGQRRCMDETWNVGNRRVRPEIEEQAIRDEATRASLREPGFDGSRADDTPLGE